MSKFKSVAKSSYSSLISSPFLFLLCDMTKSSGTVQMKFECEFNQSNE